MKTRFTIAALVALLLPSLALAQSSPNLRFDQVPTAAQWNSYFAKKQDYTGAPSLSLSGGVLTGKLVTTPSTNAASGFALPHGAAPINPVNGDVWTTSAGVFARIAGVTVGPLGPSDAAPLTGDVTKPASSNVTTLATVNGSVGNWGSSTAIPVFTVNAKGLITSVGTNTPVVAGGNVVGPTLSSSVTASSLTSFGASPTLNGPTFTGSVAALGTSFTIGPGGTAGGQSANLLLNGSSAANSGPRIFFQNAGTTNWQFGTGAAIFGDGSTDLSIYNQTLAQKAFSIAQGNNAGVFNGNFQTVSGPGPTFYPAAKTSAAIQAAADLASAANGGTVDVRACGVYTLTTTITLEPRVNLIGGGYGCTQFNRNTNYGDTIVVGHPTAPSRFATSNQIAGLWLHDETVGTITAGSTHIRVHHGNNVTINNNWIWGLDQQVLISGGTQHAIRENLFSGGPGVYAGTSSIKIIRHPSDGAIVTNMNITGNFIAAGYYQTGIDVQTSEVFNFTTNYIGGYAGDGIRFTPDYIVSGLTLSDNFFDGSVNQPGQSTIKFNYGTGMTTPSYVGGAVISNNNFFGGNGPFHSIFADRTGANISVTNLRISGNYFREIYGAPVKLAGAVGFDISNNQFLNYHYANNSPGDPDYAAGIYILGGGGGLSRAGTISGNRFGSNDYAAGSDPLNHIQWGIYTGGGVQDVALYGNEGYVKTGGALVAGDITSQKTMTSSTDKAIVRSAGTVGGLQSSVPTISDAGQVSTSAAGGGQISGFLVNSNSPSYGWTCANCATDAKTWDAIAGANNWSLRALNDANNAFTNAIVVTRNTGTALTSVAVPSAPMVFGTIGSVLGQAAFNGSTSGSATIQSQAVAGSPVLTLPTTSGTLASTATTPLVLNATTGALTLTPFSGDVATSGATSTLATVNSNVGTFGNSTTIPTVTVNAKGLVTAVGTAAPVVAAGNIAGQISLTTQVANTLLAANFPALTGDVTTTAGSLATAIGSGKVTNAMLAGSIAASKLVGTDIATVGTVTAGTWGATNIGLAFGGTNANLSATGGTGQYVKQATLGGAFSVGTIAAADLPLATTGAFGAVKPDGTTITISGGVITASGASATAVTVGTTLVGSSTSGHLLYNNAGTLGGQTITTALGARTTLPTKQQFLSGSGTYTTPANVLWIEVRLVGGGGGGGGSGTTPGNGGAGGNTTFGSLAANGGGGGFGTYGGGSAGSATAGTNDDAITGAAGGTGQQVSAGAAGGAGGSSCVGGAGVAGSGGVNPAAGTTNTGGGGGGGYQASGGTPSSGGGGSGGCVRAIITTPSATYSYAVGAGGTGGTSTGGQAGGPGATGRISVVEHYGT